MQARTAGRGFESHQHRSSATAIRCRIIVAMCGVSQGNTCAPANSEARKGKCWHYRVVELHPFEGAASEAGRWCHSIPGTSCAMSPE